MKPNTAYNTPPSASLSASGTCSEGNITTEPDRSWTSHEQAQPLMFLERTQLHSSPLLRQKSRTEPRIVLVEESLDDLLAEGLIRRQIYRIRSSRDHLAMRRSQSTNALDVLFNSETRAIGCIPRTLSLPVLCTDDHMSPSPYPSSSSLEPSPYFINSNTISLSERRFMSPGILAGNTSGEIANFSLERPNNIPPTLQNDRIERSTERSPKQQPSRSSPSVHESDCAKQEREDRPAATSRRIKKLPHRRVTYRPRPRKKKQYEQYLGQWKLDTSPK